MVTGTKAIVLPSNVLKAIGAPRIVDSLGDGVRHTGQREREPEGRATICLFLIFHSPLCLTASQKPPCCAVCSSRGLTARSGRWG